MIAHKVACMVLLSGVFIILCSCGGGKKEHEDADTDLDVEIEAEEEVPVDGDDEDGELVPLPCAVDSDCTDSDPCNGNERCDPETLFCVPGEFQPDGAICSLEPRRICLSGVCSESLCGDGFLDPGSDEFCEPPGEGDCDGDCLLICEGDPDCASDGNLCNGREYCNLDTSRCSRRDRPEDGRACSEDPRGICLGGICTDSLCGDGFVDAGGGEFCEPPYEADCDHDCQLLCDGDPDCADDGDLCNGDEFCSTDTSRCSRQNPAPAGTLCLSDPRSICLAGLCRRSLCGDGFLDAAEGEFCEPPYEGDCDGDCQIFCGGDPDCLDDGEICNGQEYCDMDTSRCSRRDIPLAGTACDDRDPSTGPDTCNGMGTCVGQTGCVLGSLVLAAAGSSHTCAVSETGGVQCWGRNDAGQLGDGTTVDKTMPVQVLGLSSGVSTMAASRQHTCALLGSGGMQCWGSNESGQLGDGTTTQRTVAVDVVGLSSSVSGVAAGNNHTCALLDTRGIQCWGDNAYGQLGDGTTTDRTMPVDVAGLASGAVAIAAGQRHTCALLDTGGMQCWGYNVNGQLGDTTTVDRAAPVHVLGLASGATALSAGAAHTCALLDTGGVQCWGWNLFGQLGDGTETHRAAPVDVAGLASGVSAVTAGGTYTCALLDTGIIRCWGGNSAGQLGDLTTTNRSSPADFVPLVSGASTVSAGGNHTCAILDTGNIQCWGGNTSGQLGNGVTSQKPVPVDVAGLAPGAAAVAAGGYHACTTLDAGGIQCWGSNENGHLGDGTTVNKTSAVDVAGLASRAEAVAVGYNHTCTLLETRGIQCWGNNANGQLGDGTTVDRTLPTDVAGLGSGAAAVEAGFSHTCALLGAGGVQCWGRNHFGQLGDNTTIDSPNPTDVVGLASAATAIDSSLLHTCAVLDTGGVQCWGLNMDGQLGEGSTVNRPSPVDVVGLASGAAAVSTGTDHTCALLDTGGIQCWGDNTYGQLGDGTTTQSLTAVDVVGLSSMASAVAAGEGHTCALLDTGSLQCWGSNASGQLGDGTLTQRLTAVDVLGLPSLVSAVHAGSSYNCALLDTGRVLCWGDDDLGQVSGFFSGYPQDVVCGE